MWRCSISITLAKDSLLSDGVERQYQRASSQVCKLGGHLGKRLRLLFPVTQDYLLEWGVSYKTGNGLKTISIPTISFLRAAIVIVVVWTLRFLQLFKSLS